MAFFVIFVFVFVSENKYDDDDEIFARFCFNQVKSGRCPAEFSGQNPKTSHPPENNKTQLFQYIKQFGTLYR